SFFVYWGSKAATRGQWDRAGADLAKALEIGETDKRVAFALALVRLRQGDLKGYQRMCADWSERHGRKPEDQAWFRRVWLCALHPQALADWGVAVEAAERQVA